MIPAPSAALPTGFMGAADSLTGLLDEVQARARLGQWQAVQEGNLQAMLIALGEFGALNTAFGRKAGDAILLETARRIAWFAAEEFAGRPALLARVGGSSFLVAVQGDTSRKRWQWLAEALADLLARPYQAGENTASIRLWPRVVLARAGLQEAPADLLDKLAEGLNRLKEAGAARTAWVGGEPGMFGAGRRQLETDLLSALDRDEISVVFQPQYSCRDGRLIGAEALARWNHREAGQLGAATLFAVAERINFGAQLSRHIIALALREAAGWAGQLRLSVNATAGDLAAGSFGDELVRLAGDARFPLHRLTVEITEESLLGDIAEVSASLARLSGQGVCIALDDFGAGFCNFRYLKLLPLRLLKLDRAMIEGVVEDARDLAVLRGIIAMAKALSLEVMAEGVENEEQRALAAAEGCVYYQGFLGSGPVDGQTFVRLAAASV